jgi:hypothetical protein
MPFIPRQVKPPTRVAITCKVPEAVATLLKLYAEFLDSSQEYVVAETLRVAFHRDREFQTWLASAHPERRMAEPRIDADPRPQENHQSPLPALVPARTGRSFTDDDRRAR